MNKHGSKWIRPKKRRKIYCRDNWTCVYCGIYMPEDKVASHVRTLDHIIPRSKGGSNDETNLVTCCVTCNSRRKDKELQGDILSKALAVASVAL